MPVIVSTYTVPVSLKGIQYPKKISRLLDLNNVKSRAENRESPTDKIYGVAIGILGDFDNFVSKNIKEELTMYAPVFETEILNKGKLPILLKDFKEAVRKSHDQIIQIEPTLDNDVDKLLYLLVRRHSKIANIIMKKYDGSDISIEWFKMHFEKLRNNDPEEIQRHALGVFVALEPILVSAALSNFKFANPKFLANYERLVNRFARVVARLYPLEYADEMGLNQVKEHLNIYSKFFVENASIPN